MVMVLEKGKVCQYAAKCPYNNTTTESNKCYGARSNRDNEFFCEFVVDGQIVENAGTRLQQDKTGKMKILVE